MAETKKKETSYSPEKYQKYKESIRRAQLKYRAKNRVKIKEKQLEMYHNLSPEKRRIRLEQMKVYNKKFRSRHSEKTPSEIPVN